MRFAAAWLCAVSALALSACHRPEKTATQPSAKPPATAGLANGKPTAATAAGAEGGSGASAGRSPSATAKAAAARAGAASSPATPVRTASRAPSQRLSASDAAAADDGADLAPAALRPRAPHGFSAEYAACVASANGYTTALANCHTAELARQSARVDRAYSAALAARGGEAARRLERAQRAWLERRDADCQDDAGRRSLDVLSEGSCRIDMTIQRAITLEHMLG